MWTVRWVSVCFVSSSEYKVSEISRVWLGGQTGFVNCAIVDLNGCVCMCVFHMDDDLSVIALWDRAHKNNGQ